ncbi:hypothetical protein ONS95_007454 [Cadophora gregata]|uniref:uncharacterized protein n=1 Tax=Cadophora gregata TaxID=51156 RepID=UPI0026DACEC4|nr:uncharacterized protein ONS95_007454 [Cadophora gregata]KAK0125822.1 hypothetical protein ONS95_007454 [Cadophora gregata]
MVTDLVSADVLSKTYIANGHRTRKQALQAIFILIGWITMAYETMFPAVDSAMFQVRCLPNKSPSSQALSQADRFFVELLQGFGSRLPGKFECTQMAGSSSIDLQVSNLNAVTIKEIGDIEFSWTMSISFHLDFDSDSQTLSLFCLPSFIALQGSEGQGSTGFTGSTFTRLLDGYYEEYNMPPNFSPVRTPSRSKSIVSLDICR